MKLRKISTTLTASLVFSILSLPGAFAVTDTSGQASYPLPAGYDIESSYCFEQAGSTLASSRDGSTLILSDASKTSGCGLGNPQMDQKVWISSDSGQSWVDSGLPTTEWGPVAISGDGSTFVAGDNGLNGASGPLWISNDNGVSWRQAISASHESGSPSHDHIWWDIDISDDGRIIVASSDGSAFPHISFDSGQTWQVITHAATDDPSGSPSLRWRGVAISGDGSTLVLCRNDAINLSDANDGGFELFVANLQEGQTSLTASDLVSLIAQASTPAKENCGAIDLDQSGDSLILGGFWSNYLGVFKRENSTWTRTLNHDFNPDYPMSVQVADNGTTMMVTFWDTPTVAISFDGGSHWALMGPEGGSSPLAVLSGDGTLLYGIDWATSKMLRVPISGAQREVPADQKIAFIQYYEPNLISDINPDFTSAVTTSMVGAPAGANAEGAGYDSVTKKNWVLFDNCSIHNLDLETSTLTEVATLSEILQAGSPAFCRGFAVAEGNAYASTDQEIIKLDLAELSLVGNPVPLTSVTALAWNGAEDDLWAFFVTETASGIVDYAAGTFQTRFSMDNLHLENSSFGLIHYEIWAADFDSTGILWAVGYTANTGHIGRTFTIDPYASDPGATLKVQRNPIGGEMTADAIWLLPNPDFVSGQSNSSQSNSSQSNSQTVAEPAPSAKDFLISLPTVHRVERLDGNRVAITGEKLALVAQLEVGSRALRVLSHSDSMLVVELIAKESVLDLVLIGPFGRLTMQGVSVRQSEVIAVQNQIEKRALFRVTKSESGLSLKPDSAKLSMLASGGAAKVTCTGYTIGDLSNRGTRVAALERAKRVCASLTALNPNLEIELRVDKRKYFGRSVHVMVSAEN